MSLHSLPQVGEVVLMTHLARADELDNPRTNEQASVLHMLRREWWRQQVCVTLQVCLVGQGCTVIGVGPG